MSELARASARLLWFAMLWYMRRPFIKRLQKRWILMVPEERRHKAWRSFCDQNRWARRYGLSLLVVCFNLLYASILLTFTYFGVVWLYTRGAFEVPR